MPHEKFHYRSLEEVQETAKAQRGALSLSENMSCLAQPLSAGRIRTRNRIALQPMEGTDGTDGGSPTELTKRRYLRFAKGGAGLIWFEAVAVAPEARASLHQLYLTEENLSDFQRLVEAIKEDGLRENGFAPYLAMQATHSGRYSKPDGTPHPLIAQHNPILEEGLEHLPFRVLTDDELKRSEDFFADTARLAERAGFDAVDVKCCHRYLASELLSAYNREGAYGGSFENRTRYIRNCVRAAKSACNIHIACRMNAYDGFPYPWGFGVTEETGLEPDLAEAKALAKLLAQDGVELFNVTIGNPYKNPHVNRPYDAGAYTPAEHPLCGVVRIMDCCAEIQSMVPKLPVVGSGFSYLRQFSANLAAGMVGEGRISLAGFGRLALANPNFPNQIFQTGHIGRDRVCISCGQCALLLRHGIPAGCVVRDRAQYAPYTGE
ncbi:MAG: flavin oxidoreductase/NADH oxidase [Christensenellales bacterium]|jgi:2,4-dienoyl-CoA reductase-like NADH-dependent reductase (Old Yellow Enzyme family)